MAVAGFEVDTAWGGPISAATISSGEIFVASSLSAARTTVASTVTNATPAVSNGQLFLRTDKNLYCIGKK